MLPRVSPLRRVKPWRIAAHVSPEMKRATGPWRLPSMVVVDGPPDDLTMMPLPLKSMFSVYVPGAATRCVPLEPTGRFGLPACRLRDGIPWR